MATILDLEAKIAALEAELKAATERAVKAERLIDSLLEEKEAAALKEHDAEMWKKFANSIESIINEFEHDPKACLGIITEHLYGKENVEY